MAGPSKRNTNTGIRPEFKAVQQRKKIFAVLKAFCGVVLLGVLVGLGIVYKEQILALFRKPEAPKVAVAPAPVEAPKIVEKAPVIVAPRVEINVPPPTVEKKVQIAPSAEIIPTGEEEITKKLLDDGKAAMERLDFEKAAGLFKQAIAKKSGATLRKEAKIWESKATEFAKATRHITICDYAKADTSYIIKTHDDREIHCLIASETPENVRIQVVRPENPGTEGKSIWTMAANEIKDRVELSRKQRQEQFLELLGMLESSLSNIQRSSDYYDLVYLSKRLGLGRECLEYLNRAYSGGPDRPADPYLGDSFRKEVVRRTIDRCSLMLAAGRSKTYVESELNRLLKTTLPGYQVAMDEVDAFRIQVLSKVGDDFKSTLREVKKEVASKSSRNSPPAQQSAKQLTNAIEGDEIEIVVENSGVHGNGAAGPVVDKANGKYDEGMKLYRGFRQGTNGNNNEILRRAMACLEEAVSLYDQALQKDPGNKSVADRQTEANMIVYACKKYQTL